MKGELVNATLEGGRRKGKEGEGGGKGARRRRKGAKDQAGKGGVEQAEADSTTLPEQPREEGRGAQELRRLFLETFTEGREQEELEREGDRELYTLPVSLVSLSPMAGLSPAQLSWVDRQVARLGAVLATCKEQVKTTAWRVPSPVQAPAPGPLPPCLSFCLSVLSHHLAPLLGPGASQDRCFSCLSHLWLLLKCSHSIYCSTQSKPSQSQVC